MTNNSTEDLIAAVNARVMELLELPSEAREAQFALFREYHYRSAVAAGWPVDRASEIAKKMDQWTRMALEDILAHGGHQSGTA